MAIPIFYTPLMIADSLSYSPSASKPAHVLEFWQQKDIPLDVIAPKPVTRDLLYLAHDRHFVNGVLAGEIENGFGNRSPNVAASLPYTSGSMLAAARCALENGKGAVSPSSGFHHAGYDFSGGFCTLNGLMVTATTLLAESRINRLAILDLDMHWGNGTDHIIRHLGLEDIVRHHSRAATHHQAEAWLKTLPSAIAELTDGCDLLIYQAGADSHIKDPLGGYLDTEQMLRRDEIVFSSARELGIPVAWNLAGGYQRLTNGGILPVLELHYNTLRTFAHVTMGLQSEPQDPNHHSTARI